MSVLPKSNGDVCVWVGVCNRSSSVEVEGEVAVLREERDDALLRMSNAQEQAEQNAESVRHLQNALRLVHRGT